MPDSREYSPVHVTVDESTPVHVHIQKPKKPSAHAVTERLARPRHRGGSAKARGAGSGGSGGRRSKSPPKSPGPWIPPPAKSSKGAKTEAPERDTDGLADCEDRVETLIGEVGKLKSEAELARTRRELADSQDRLSSAAAQRSCLRKSVEFLADNDNNDNNEDNNNNNDNNEEEEAQDADDDGDDIGRRLGSAELELQSLNRHLLSFGDILGSLRPPMRQSERDAVLNLQLGLCDRVADASESLGRLRRRLSRRSDASAEAAALQRERSDLLRRLAASDESRRSTEAQLGDAKQRLADVRQQELAASGLQSALESAKGHLQFQLRQREADCNRLAVQLRTVETELAQARIDRDHLAELLRRSRDTSDTDKEELKKAARALKQRAAKAEEEAEAALLRCQQLQQQQQQQQQQQWSRAPGERDGQLGAEEKDRLLNSIKSLEKQLEQQRSDMESLRSTLKHYEGLIDDYKHQIRSKVAERLDEAAEADGSGGALARRPPPPSTSEQQAGQRSESLERAELSQQENRMLRDRCEDLERRLRAAEDERREAQSGLARRDESQGSLASQLEAKQRECSALIQQLEQATAESRRAGDRDGQLAREKKLQARLLELETQLAAQRAESARALRDKEEELRRTLQRCEDLRERMEQMQSTNRSLQNYVSFLKTSYANVFSGAGAAQ